jgi:2-phospho-L-lactate guanylyltransferase
MHAIVLPVKSLDAAKARLEPALTKVERAALTLAMLEDVLDATLAMPGWETWVVSPDETVLEVAARRGAMPLVEEEPPLNTAIRQAEADAIRRGLDALAVLLPDTPLLTVAALTRALHTLGPIVVAPSADERGTNLLLRRPPDAIAARFGIDSFRRHVEAAAEADLPLSVVEREEIGFDLDVPGDILTVLASSRPTRTRAVLRELSADERVGARASSGG